MTLNSTIRGTIATLTVNLHQIIIDYLSFSTTQSYFFTLGHLVICSSSTTLTNPALLQSQILVFSNWQTLVSPLATLITLSLTFSPASGR